MASMSPDEERVLTDEFIDRVTYTKEYSLKGMIRGLTLPPAVPLPPSSSSSKSSLGRLNGLPVELLHMVLVFLDGQSLVRLAETSHRAKEIVDTLPVYQELRQHIPDVLVALAKTHMLRCHGISDIQRALRSSACASCLVSFGGFFFLPTCERVCFDCLYENRALRMITLANARECFRLTARQLETGVPILNTIPGSYSVKWHKHHPNVHRLVNVRQVKAYAIKVHGSIEAVDALLPSTKPGNWSARKYNMFKSFHEASLEPPGRDLTLLPEQIDAVNDDFGGVASIRMPYLDKMGKVHRGRCCKGCLVLQVLLSKGDLPEGVRARLFPSNASQEKVLISLVSRLYTEGGFVRHIEDCYGVLKIMSWLGSDNEDPYGLNE